LIQRRGNKRLYLSVENLKEVLNDQRELKIKCYGSVAIRVKPLVNGTSTRLFKAQTAVPYSLLAKPSLTQLLLGTNPTALLLYTLSCRTKRSIPVAQSGCCRDPSLHFVPLWMTGGRGSTQNDREEDCQEEVEGAKKGKSDGEYLLVIVPT